MSIMKAKDFDDWVNLYQAFVGKVIPQFHAPNFELVDLVATRGYANAIGDINPLWRDAAYAVETRYGCIIAPPMFPLAVRYPAPYIIEPGPRGIDLLDIYKGFETEFYDVIRIMDELRSEKRLVSVEKKTGKIGLIKGPYAELVAETTIWNQHKEVVCKMRGSSLRVPRPQAGELFYEREIYSYTDEEMEKIGQGILDEFRAGNRMPLWDDVNIGDKLPTIVKSPLIIEEILNFENFIMGWAYRAYEQNYYDMLADPDMSFVHPTMRFRVPKTQTSDIIVSKELGMPIHWVPGLMSDCMIGQLLANWIGDDGFVRRASSETKYPFFYGDVLRWTGEVTDKKQNVEGNAVEVTFNATNQLDTIVTEGTATVLLPSRTCKKVNLPIPC